MKHLETVQSNSRDKINEEYVIDVDYLEIDTGQNNINDVSHKKYSSESSAYTNRTTLKDNVSSPQIRKAKLEKYRITYNIKDLFSDEEMQKVATSEDVNAIFDRNFSNFKNKEAHASLELLKSKCISLIDGGNTIEYIAFYYASKYMQILKTGQFDS